ncbi:ArsR/SmtB family transcription factor [Streptomyces sp. NBC_00576]|uniref:ArsR/SmtB family transcription factor n=1 Tax=Streptomyces sp. NBC_00576 TaxID=2903665 RepID=UPI002E81A4E2|nr:metalloregulator ArsR/SmtB family transcription factor [Streptomyces sp. NBC_00576]WUB77252.1 metalloregulator ArsR/SmtB family transcription factor [Streptomyces sp. NBC_00576]
MPRSASRGPSRCSSIGCSSTTRRAPLSDPARLSLCRHLVNEPITTSDLAVRTGMTLSQVSRHLGRLREVGLLTSRRDGRQIYHRLDTDRLTHLGVDVLTSIIR